MNGDQSQVPHGLVPVVGPGCQPLGGLRGGRVRTPQHCQTAVAPLLGLGRREAEGSGLS